MAKLEHNRSGEMEVFTKVVETGGFSSAARLFGMTPSAVSKLIARLEERLGVRLLSRSTRKLQLTVEGEQFYHRSLAILIDMEEAEQEVSHSTEPRGPVRINANLPFGQKFLLPLVPRFLECHPAITLDISLSDTVVDLFDEGADLAVRVGPLKESGLIARKLGESALAVVAAPSYVDHFGLPENPSDLDRHRLIGFNFSRQQPGWPFLQDETVSRYRVSGAVKVSDGESARRLALSGAGISRLSRFLVDEDLRTGRLVEVLGDFNPGDRDPIHVVYVGQGGPLPRRVRAVIDFLAANIRLE